MRCAPVAARYAVALACVTTCGGGGPGQPDGDNPIVLVSASPASGSTVVLTGSNDEVPGTGAMGVSAPVSLSFRVVSDHVIPLPILTAEWFDESGRFCAKNSAGSYDLGEALPVPGSPGCGTCLEAGRVTEVGVSRVYWAVVDLRPGLGGAGQCPLPATTTRVRLTIACGLCGDDGRYPPLRADVPLRWSFTAAALPGSGVLPCSSLDPRTFCTDPGPCTGVCSKSGLCGDGAATCATDPAAACAAHGGLACAVCPGPFCW